MERHFLFTFLSNVICLNFAQSQELNGWEIVKNEATIINKQIVDGMFIF